MAKTPAYRTKKPRSPKADAGASQDNAPPVAEVDEEVPLEEPVAAAPAPAPAPTPVAPPAPAPVAAAPAPPPAPAPARPVNTSSSDEQLDAETQSRYEQAKRQDLSIRDLQRM